MDPYIIIIWSVLCVRMLFLIIISSVGAYWSVREVWYFLWFRITAHDSGAHLYAFRWVSCLANQNAIRSIDYNCVSVFLSVNIATKQLFKCNNTKSPFFFLSVRQRINISPKNISQKNKSLNNIFFRMPFKWLLFRLCHCHCHCISQELQLFDIALKFHSSYDFALTHTHS